MYLIRRSWNVKPGATRQAAELIARLGKAHEDAGQRSETRVYWSGYTVPGRTNRVYMDWVQETIESPFREGNPLPSAGDAGARLRELTQGSRIEFYEMVPRGPDSEV